MTGFELRSREKHDFFMEQQDCSGGSGEAWPPTPTSTTESITPFAELQGWFQCVCGDGQVRYMPIDSNNCTMTGSFMMLEQAANGCCPAMQLRGQNLTLGIWCAKFQMNFALRCERS